MQGIRADNAFGLLSNFSLCIGRQKLGAYGSIDDIPEIFRACGENIVFDKAVNHPADKRFRYACVDSVHAHVVAVVGAPAERKLAQVARADNNSVRLARIIHENLRSLPRL